MIYYDDTYCMWRVGDGEADGDNPAAWSLGGCAAAVPEDVEHWEHYEEDDGRCMGIYANRMEDDERFVSLLV